MEPHLKAERKRQQDLERRRQGVAEAAARAREEEEAKKAREAEVRRNWENLQGKISGLQELLDTPSQPESGEGDLEDLHLLPQEAWHILESTWEIGEESEQQPVPAPAVTDVQGGLSTPEEPSFRPPSYGARR